MAFNLSATVINVGDVNQVSDSFRKRELVVEYATNPMYPQTILLQAVQDRCDLLDGISKGDEVEIHFNLNGRVWDDTKNNRKRVFNSLDIWKIEKKTDSHTGEVIQSVASQPDPTLLEDGLPF